MGRGRTRVLVAIGAVAVAALAACSDDGPPPAITQEAYDQRVTELCDRHGEFLTEAAERHEASASSDAERVSYFRSEYIPRVRTLIRSLADTGLPEDRYSEYTGALSRALTALDEFDANASVFVDKFRLGTLEDDDNYVQRVNTALDEAGIPCLR